MEPEKKPKEEATASVEETQKKKSDDSKINEVDEFLDRLDYSPQKRIKKSWNIKPKSIDFNENMITFSLVWNTDKTKTGGLTAKDFIDE